MFQGHAIMLLVCFMNVVGTKVSLNPTFKTPACGRFSTFCYIATSFIRYDFPCNEDFPNLVPLVFPRLSCIVFLCMISCSSFSFFSVSSLSFPSCTTCTICYINGQHNGQQNKIDLILYGTRICSYCVITLLNIISELHRNCF